MQCNKMKEPRPGEEERWTRRVRGYVGTCRRPIGRERKHQTRERSGGSLAAVSLGPGLDEFCCFTAGVMIHSSTKLVNSHSTGLPPVSWVL